MEMANDPTKKEVALASLVYKNGDLFVPSDKEQQVVSEVIDLFRASAQSRDRRFKYFDNRTLIEYIEDSVHRFYTNVDEREGI